MTHPLKIVEISLNIYILLMSSCSLNNLGRLVREQIPTDYYLSAYQRVVEVIVVFF